MKKKSSPELAQLIQRFFEDYLPGLRGVSTHTIRSYRDALVLFLRFLATETRRGIEMLEITRRDAAVNFERTGPRRSIWRSSASRVQRSMAIGCTCHRTMPPIRSIGPTCALATWKSCSGFRRPRVAWKLKASDYASLPSPTSEYSH
jgi:hypothetical protein